LLLLSNHGSRITSANGFSVMPPGSQRLGCSRHGFLQSTMKEETSLLEDDETLLSQVSQQQLLDYCKQLRIAIHSNHSKAELLEKLRRYAAEQKNQEKRRREQLAILVEQGSSADSPKERYEVIGGNSPEFYYQMHDGEEEDDDFFVPIPLMSEATIPSQSETTQQRKPIHITQGAITAPPPPLEPNEFGERVVQVYSTTEQNDLTGSTSSSSSFGQQTVATNQPWEMEQTARAQKPNAQQLERYQEQVSELVQTLLAMSGAPAFMDDSDGLSHVAKSQSGFQPAQVPTELLLQTSQALQAEGGQVLDDVLRSWELQALAYDENSRDGVHYREVSKVRAFLEGYRRAEVRRIARETTALLLDKLILEGVQGLDATLATMMRSGSEATMNSGGSQLNDSLLDYLNDAIRQQEQAVGNLQKTGISDHVVEVDGGKDSINDLWNVTLEDGQLVESIDPNDPQVLKALQNEYAKQSQAPNERYRQVSSVLAPSPYSSVPDKQRLLLLLTLLRERLRTEAAFDNTSRDEKASNLRLLAYCLRVTSVTDREQLILNDIGGSLDVSCRNRSMTRASALPHVPSFQ
jgi:hypothetical protein